MRELGIAPVLQGYYGMVPYKFKEKHPGARIVEQGIWAGGNRRPDMLDPADPLFAPIARAFYEEQKKSSAKICILPPIRFMRAGTPAI